ncbi:MAG: NAD(P)H-binding protein, partial [bacterium]|nr:NAD(P)H-binding protein [bacterium]
MKQKRVLIAGGYGAVGGRLSRIFAGNKNIIPVVAGRNETKASVLAKELNCQWQVVDLEDKESIREALDGIDIVINCFIASENFNLYLPETAIEKGIHYLDLSGYNEYCEGIIRLKDSAEKNESLLITALGAYPCIGGLVLASNKDYFDEIASVDIYFTMGGKLGGLSVLSLKGANYMVNTAPLVWKEGQWRKPDKTSTKEHVGGPFNKKISFYPGMITYDLYFVPGLEKIKHIASWSGMENMFQALVFVIGMKLGWAKNDKRAKRFLKILKYLGRGKKNHEDISLKIV